MNNLIIILIFIIGIKLKDVNNLKELQTILKENKKAMVVFYSPKCFFSIQFLSTDLKKLKIPYFLVDCIKTPQICIVYQIYSYPIVYFNYKDTFFKYDEILEIDSIKSNLNIMKIRNINNILNYEKFILTYNSYKFLKFSQLYNNIKVFQLYDLSIFNEFKKNNNLKTNFIGGIKIGENNYKFQDIKPNFHQVNDYFLYKPEYLNENHNYETIIIYYNKYSDITKDVKNKLYFLNLWLNNNKIYILNENNKNDFLKKFNLDNNNNNEDLKRHNILIYKKKLNKKYLNSEEEIEDVGTYIYLEDLIKDDFTGEEYYNNEKIIDYYYNKDLKIYNWNFKHFDEYMTNNNSKFIVLIYKNKEILEEFKKFKKENENENYWFAIIDYNRNDFPGYEINDVPIIIKKDKEIKSFKIIDNKININLKLDNIKIDL